MLFKAAFICLYNISEYYCLNLKLKVFLVYKIKVYFSPVMTKMNFQHHYSSLQCD